MCQTHFTNGFALGFRNMEFIKNMGFKLKNDSAAYSFPNFVKELFFDSETSMIVISGVPGKETNKDAQGKVLEGTKRGGGLLPSWLMSQRKKEINDLAGCRVPSARGTARPTITGIAARIVPIRQPCSSKWSRR